MQYYGVKCVRQRPWLREPQGSLMFPSWLAIPEDTHRFADLSSSRYVPREVCVAPLDTLVPTRQE